MRWAAGAFEVLEYRAPGTVLPAGVAVGADFLSTGAGLRSIVTSSEVLAALRALQRAKRTATGPKRVRTVEQALKRAKRVFDVLRAEGVIGKKKRRHPHG
jgi:hypothetical protein